MIVKIFSFKFSYSFGVKMVSMVSIIVKKSLQTFYLKILIRTTMSMVFHQ